MYVFIQVLFTLFMNNDLENSTQNTDIPSKGTDIQLSVFALSSPGSGYFFTDTIASW